jgi:ribose transport system substrate-binding protein
MNEVLVLIGANPTEKGFWKMRKILATVLAMVLVLSLFTVVNAEAGKYGVAVPNATNSFYATCIAGVEEGVKEYDPECSVIVTDAGFDSGKQLDQVNDLISQGCRAIVLIPVDSNSILPAIDECKAAGIPVFVMDTPAGEHDGVIATVTANNYSAGEIAGSALIKAIGGKGKIVTITTTGSEAVNQRKQALYDQLKNYPDIQIVQEEIVQKGTTEEAQTIMENLIQSIPDLAGVFTTGDVFAIGICAALQANGFAAGDVKVTSVDGTKNAIELIKSGYLTATAAQLPAELGKTCVKNAVDYFAGKTVEKNQQLLCSEINADNYTQYTGF